VPRLQRNAFRRAPLAERIPTARWLNNINSQRTAGIQRRAVPSPSGLQLRQGQLDAVAMRRLASSILCVLPGEVAATAESGVAVLDSWFYSTVHIVQSIWLELCIDRFISKLLVNHGVRQPFDRALFAMVSNRTSALCSKLYCRQSAIVARGSVSTEEREIEIAAPLPSDEFP
jgi:hypothetical protein